MHPLRHHNGAGDVTNSVFYSNCVMRGGHIATSFIICHGHLCNVIFIITLCSLMLLSFVYFIAYLSYVPNLLQSALPFVTL